MKRAKTKYNKKVMKLCNNKVISNLNNCTEENAVPLIQAIVDKFTDNLEKTTTARLKQLLQAVDNFKGSFRPDIKTKKALVSALKTDFLGMEPDDIVNEVMSPEEYEFINSKLAHRHVDKVMSTDPLDLPALATEGRYGGLIKIFLKFT